MGRNLSRQIEVTGNEHDDVHEVGCAAVTTGPILGQLEETIDPFGGCIGGSGDWMWARHRVLRPPSGS